MQIGQLTVPEGLKPQGSPSVPAHAAARARRLHRSSRFPGSTRGLCLSTGTSQTLMRRPASPSGVQWAPQDRRRWEQEQGQQPDGPRPPPPRLCSLQRPCRGGGGTSSLGHSHPACWCLTHPGHSGDSSGPVPAAGQMFNEPFSNQGPAFPAPCPLPHWEMESGERIPFWGLRRSHGARGFLAEEPVPIVACRYLSPVAASSLVFLGVWVVTYTSLSLASSSSSLLTTQLSAWSWRCLLAVRLGRLLSKA